MDHCDVLEGSRLRTATHPSLSISYDSDEDYKVAVEAMSMAVTALRGKLDNTDEDDEGYSTVVSKSTIKRKIKSYTREDCVRFSTLYNNYFMACYGIKIDFIITPASQPYISALEACMERDHVLVTLFDRRPVIVDVYGGSGSDALAFILDMNPKEYIACDHCSPGNEIEMEQWAVLKHNVQIVKLAFEELRTYVKGKMTDAPITKCIKMDAKEYIMQLPMGSHIDILYLDPNWNIGSKSGHELSRQGMVTYLNKNVIIPLSERNIQPKCIVFKTRWASSILMPFMELLNKDYHSMYSIEATPFQDYVDEKKFEKEGEIEGRFHWIIIVHNELKKIVWERSQLFVDVIRRGTKVIIRKSDLLHPFIPEYAKKRVIPKEQDQEDGDETFVVEGVPRIHRLPASTRNHRRPG